MLLVDQQIEPDPIASFAIDLAWDTIRARSEVRGDRIVAFCAHCLQAFELVGMPCDTHATDEERAERELRLGVASEVRT